MNNQERLQRFQQELTKLDGLDEDRYRRLTKELTRERTQYGYDEQGRLVVTMFDSKSYDVESFTRSNQDRRAMRFIEPSLDRITANAAKGSKVICIFCNDKCDTATVEVLAELGVELIALRCAGFNNVDLDACEKLGISVVHVPAYSPNAVAEHTVALMLTLNRHLHQAYQRNRSGYFVLDGLTGFDMRGKTVGVIGTGQIGRCAIDILLGFGCRILAFDKFPHESLVNREHVQYAELSRVFAESDIITLHIPLFPETHHIVDRAAISQMKDGVMLINTSRGGLVDTKALIDGLKAERIGAAGLDVYEEEAGVFFHDISDRVLTDDVLARLLTFNNVVITSHQAFLTQEALANIAETTLANVDEFEVGKRSKELTNSVLG
jgi:D-lactate dehydrogenase